MSASRKWRSLAELQQAQTAQPVTVEPTIVVDTVEPPDTINDTGREAIALLKRWRANANDDGAAVTTLLAVFGRQGPIGRMVVRWRPMPMDVCLVDVAYKNGARLADMGPAPQCVLRSSAAAEMIRHRIEPGKRRKSMGFQTHAALLGYWRERRELLHALRTLLHGTERQQAGMMDRSVEALVRRLEDLNVRIMSPGGGCDGK